MGELENARLTEGGRPGNLCQTSSAMRLDLTDIPPALHRQAREAFEQGDVQGFLGYADNLYGLNIVFRNLPFLLRRSLYEQALFRAVTQTRTNHYGGFGLLRFLVGMADRARLLASGDPLPGPGPFVLYRGVGGNGRARYIRGFSWTASLDRAIWFADRATRYGLSNPAVYRAEVPAKYVLFHTNDRQEEEFFVALPPHVKVVPIDREVRSLP